MNSPANKPITLYVFYCSNSFNNDELTRSFPGGKGDEFKFISLPCSGKADILYFLKAFEMGADGLVLITCPKNECHYLEGNLRAPRRAEQVSLILEETGFDEDRVLVLNEGGGDIGQIAAKVNSFRDTIRGLSSGRFIEKNMRCSADASCAAHD